MLDIDFASTVLYHLRYELLFSALFALVLLLSPDAWAKLSGKKAKQIKGKKVAPRKEDLPKDPLALAAHLSDLASTRYSKAMDLFQQTEAVLCELPWQEHMKVLAALAVASVRVGRVDRLSEVFQRLKGREEDEVGSILVHVMRVLASRQQYADALATMDLWRKEVTTAAEAVPSLAVSCLVQCAVELRNVGQAQEYFKLLQQRKDAVARDYSAMIRLFAAQSMADDARAMLEEMQQAGMAPDNVAYNMVLSACSNAGQGSQASALLAQMTDADIVTYNTRLKGCVKTKDVQQAFDIYEELKASSIQPTQVTYGTLLEVCTRAQDLTRARQVLKMMTEANIPKNNIVYTSMIKGLAAAGQVKEAMEVFEELQRDASVKPDVICFSVLIKGQCDQGDLDAALKLLEALLEAGHTPDEILFNNLLSGCAQKPHVQLGEKILADMVHHGIKPTMATFSIMLKMYSKAGAFQQSASLLEEMPNKYGVVPAPRLYVQHISWCIRLRRGASALQVFQMLLERCPEAKGLDSFLTACSSFNMMDTACSLVEIDPTRFSTAVIRDMSEVLERKKKTALLGRVEAALRKQAMRKDE